VSRRVNYDLPRFLVELFLKVKSSFSGKEATGLDGHHKWGKEECP
jgi:hypothetical protein